MVANSSTIDSRLPIISFFSGGGFLDMAFEQAGFHIAFSNELDKDFSQFYKEGMSSWAGTEREISYVGDMVDISFRDIEDVIKRPFGIIGGPPCQDFSIRGKRVGFDGIRGTHTYHFYEKIMDFHPDFFLMENVPGLVLLKHTKDDFLSILDMFREAYHISYARMNALHYGVPQNRERLFVIGIKKESFTTFTQNTIDNGWFNWPTPIYPDAEKLYQWGEPTFKELSKKNLPAPPIELCVSNVMINGENTLIANALEFFNLKNPKKIENIEEGDTYRPSFKRLHRNKYSPTACYGNNEVHLHPFENRRLSVREALRIQGVPDSYILNTTGKLTKKFKMIGNGVPVPVASSVARSLNTYLTFLQNYKEKKNGYLVEREEEPSNG